MVKNEKVSRKIRTAKNYLNQNVNMKKSGGSGRVDSAHLSTSQ
jgi:hypothetical protein